MKDKFISRIDSLLQESILSDNALNELSTFKTYLETHDVLNRKELEYFESNISAYEMLLQFL